MKKSRRLILFKRLFLVVMVNCLRDFFGGGIGAYYWNFKLQVLKLLNVAKFNAKMYTLFKKKKSIDHITKRYLNILKFCSYPDKALKSVMMSVLRIVTEPWKEKLTQLLKHYE